jgi:alpha/beta superfamily hydrolase
VTTLTTADGLTLEAAWDAPPGEVDGVVVFCHPHPRQDGTMNAPLMRAVAGALTDRGLAVLRFNFRGVGASEGRYDDGIGEVDDVAAAVETARVEHPGLPFGIAGWSFGAVTALAWQARERDTSRYAGIAPPRRLSSGEEIVPAARLEPAERLFVLGDRDQFTTPQELGEYVEAVGGRLEVLAGSDHFFHFREAKVGGLLADHFLEGR